MMICLICRQTEIISSFTSVKFQRGEFQLIVNGVPARVCSACGEAYIDEEVTARLLQDAQERFEMGMFDVQYEYQAD